MDSFNARRLVSRKRLVLVEAMNPLKKTTGYGLDVLGHDIFSILLITISCILQIYGHRSIAYKKSSALLTRPSLSLVAARVQSRLSR